MPLAGSPTPLISPTSSAIGTRTILTPPLRLPTASSPIHPPPGQPLPSPLTPLTPAYSPQFGLGVSTVGSSSVFPPPHLLPTTNKLIPRHERSTVTTTTATPRTLPTGPGLNSSGGGYHPPPPFLSSLTPESTFSLPIPVPGSPSPSPWATAPAHLHHHHQQPAVISGGGNRGSGSASSCYTGTGTGTSTAHSSLRHEIPIAIPIRRTREGRDPAAAAAAAIAIVIAIAALSRTTPRVAVTLAPAETARGDAGDSRLAHARCCRGRYRGWQGRVRK
ncbi:hypothetical protein NEMBOFW57_010023 [Staphylotrichum longicolle]|uniref:Uncharacterized protein n=1 Tax=Staphylotrichum longicolle TaxID=669026 RepID=A0AAD4EQC3_9PEZI|nr:hypothetical protein NEMBOFW57_010023 [Staphylotrichum longicolle]